MLCLLMKGWFVGLKNFQIPIILTSLSVCAHVHSILLDFCHTNLNTAHFSRIRLPFYFSPQFHVMLSDKILIFFYCFTRGQAEMEFKVEVEAIGRVRHKNLVRLLGYCVEGAYR